MYQYKQCGRWQDVLRNEKIVHFVGSYYMCWNCSHLITKQNIRFVNPLNSKRRPLYLKTQSVPRCKHFSSRL